MGKPSLGAFLPRPEDAMKVRTLLLGGLAAGLLLPLPARADIPTRQVLIDARIVETATPVVGKLGFSVFGGYEFVSRDFKDTFKGGSFSETTDYHTFVVGGAVHYGKTTLTGLYQGSFSESGVFDESLKAFEVSLSHQLIVTPRLVGGTPVLVIAPHVEFNHDRVGGIGFDATGFGAGARFYPTGPGGRVSVYAGFTYFPFVGSSGYGSDFEGDDGFKAAAGVDVKVPAISGTVGLGYIFRNLNGSGKGFDHRQNDHRVQLLIVITPRILNPLD